jgi:hypothetical protein
LGYIFTLYGKIAFPGSDYLSGSSGAALRKDSFFPSIVGHKFSAPLLIFNLTSSAPLERSNARGCALQGIDSDYEKD